MLNFFSRSSDLHADDGTVYRFKEPSLTSVPAAAPAMQRMPSRFAREGMKPAPAALPTNYGDIVQFFRRTVAERKSAYNQLCRAADQLKDYIPDEISRLKVAHGMLREQFSAEALSLAISTHIGDIDLARQKAGKHTPEMVAAETVRLEGELEKTQQGRDALAAEIDVLKQQMAQLQARLDGEETALAKLREQLDSVRANVNSAAFLDQAAENEKNDLLARKALLGLN
ncbi:MAG: hypothetical protein JWP36_2172 [Paucimonas sp.]|nr:hypothetical protein [Paucimonas sp.]